MSAQQGSALLERQSDEPDIQKPHLFRFEGRWFIARDRHGEGETYRFSFIAAAPIARRFWIDAGGCV